MKTTKVYRLQIGDIITISEPYMKFLLEKVESIPNTKFNLFKPSTWKKERLYKIRIVDLKDD